MFTVYTNKVFTSACPFLGSNTYNFEGTIEFLKQPMD